MKLFCTLACLLLLASLTHCQTLTNADLGKKLHRPPASADVYEMLKAHEYHVPPTLPTAPLIITIGANGPMLGPWSFPPDTPARRLDGTSFDTPPIIYGAPYYWPLFGSIAQHSHSERERAPRREQR